MKDGNRKDLLIAVVTAGLCTAAVEGVKAGVSLGYTVLAEAKRKRAKAAKLRSKASRGKQE